MNETVTTVNTTTLMDWMHQGGIVMWILLGFSIVIVASVIERYVVLRRARVEMRPLMAGLEEALWRQHSTSAALRICDDASGVVPVVARAGLERFDRTAARVEKTIERRASTELRRLNRRLGVLTSMAVAAPLLGFLGTVVGMMLSFEALANFGQANPTLVADGINHALTTTAAAGLAVALPAQLSYNFLSARIDQIAGDMETVGYMLIEARQDFDHEGTALIA